MPSETVNGPLPVMGAGLRFVCADTQPVARSGGASDQFCHRPAIASLHGSDQMLHPRGCGAGTSTRMGEGEVGMLLLGWTRDVRWESGATGVAGAFKRGTLLPIR